jgi:CheY-like chemotaxis protein/transcriptional regulator with XRE-family HTH domain
MGTFEEFEHDLRDGLAHLYDPTYQPSQLLWQVTGSDPKQGVQPLQALFIQAIENLKPASHVPPNARIRLIYNVLSCRYLQNLTQAEAAKRIGITPRTLRRIQQQAVKLLAQRLWNQSRPETPPAVSDISPEDETQSLEETEEDEWRSQLKHELATLQESTPGLVTNVGEVIQGIVEVGRALTSKHDVSLQVELSAPPQPITTAHTSILRQVLIRAIDRLVLHMSSGGKITIYAEEEGDQVKITIAGHPVTSENQLYSDFIQEALTTQDGSLEVQAEGERIIFQVVIPSAYKVTVLVVDDNTDLVHFYRRYVAGTRYEIIHLAEGQSLFEVIEDSSPDIIVLDVMLPGVDGWELLTHLHEHPDTRSIPVIVCSVVRGAEMASALGAALYLQKPVRSRQFIEALDRVLSQASTKGPKAEANPATTD